MDFAQRSLVSHAELATQKLKRTPSRRCAVTACRPFFHWLNESSRSRIILLFMKYGTSQRAIVLKNATTETASATLLAVLKYA
jgi:hypothetical protein